MAAGQAVSDYLARDPAGAALGAAATGCLMTIAAGAGEPGASGTPMVLAEALHKRFGRLEVLRGIDLQVARREVVCIIGPSGSGKSPFLRCINHLEKINAGRLWVDGSLVGYREYAGRLHELREKEVCAERAQIGMVF